jgi:hypothetical protein
MPHPLAIPPEKGTRSMIVKTQPAKTAGNADIFVGAVLSIMINIGLLGLGGAVSFGIWLFGVRGYWLLIPLVWAVALMFAPLLGARLRINRKRYPRVAPGAGA